MYFVFNKSNIKNTRVLNLGYKQADSKQHELKYLGCTSNETLSIETMMIKITGKVNSRLIS